MSTAREHPAQLGAEWLPAQTLVSGIRLARPALAAATNGRISMAWEAEDAVFHSQWDGDAWGAPVRVCGGVCPTLRYGADGVLYMAFSNDFSGRWEVYECALGQGGWTLPLNISYSPGISLRPQIVIAPGDRRHAVWEDTTPGYPVIYHGWHRSGWRWSNYAIPNVAGRRPSAQCDDRGVLHLAYQTGDDDLREGNVFYTCWQGGVWRLPQLISSGEHPAGDVALTVDASYRAHAVWRERMADHDEIMYASGLPDAWTHPIALSPALDQGSGTGLALAPGRRLHAAWGYAATLEATLRGLDHPVWDPVELAARAAGAIHDPAVVVESNGRVHAAWIMHEVDGPSELRHVVRKAPATYQTFIPRVMAGDGGV